MIPSSLDDLRRYGIEMILVMNLYSRSREEHDVMLSTARDIRAHTVISHFRVHRELRSNPLKGPTTADVKVAIETGELISPRPRLFETNRDATG